MRRVITVCPFLLIQEFDNRAFQTGSHTLLIPQNVTFWEQTRGEYAQLPFAAVPHATISSHPTMYSTRPLRARYRPRPLLVRINRMQRTYWRAPQPQSWEQYPETADGQRCSQADRSPQHTSK